MKIKNINIKEIKDLPSKLKMAENYLNESKKYFNELDKILNNIDLSDTDKVIMINNQYKEFERSVINGL